MKDSGTRPQSASWGAGLTSPTSLSTTRTGSPAGVCTGKYVVKILRCCLFLLEPPRLLWCELQLYLLAAARHGGAAVAVADEAAGRVRPAGGGRLEEAELLAVPVGQVAAAHCSVQVYSFIYTYL